MKRLQVQKKGGYRYCCSEEVLKEYMALSPEMKLRWLEEANRFSYLATSPKIRRIKEKFRRGAI